MSKQKYGKFIKLLGFILQFEVMISFVCQSRKGQT